MNRSAEVFNLEFQLEGDTARLTILQALPMPLSAHEKAAQNRRTPKRYRENESA